MPAQYFCSGELAQEEWHHYGLAAPIYTHFTSPIRRYADVCVHRLLGAAIGVSPLPTFLMDKVRALYFRWICYEYDAKSLELFRALRTQPHGVVIFLSPLLLQALLHDLTENMNRRHRSAQLAGITGLYSACACFLTG